MKRGEIPGRDKILLGLSKLSGARIKQLISLLCGMQEESSESLKRYLYPRTEHAVIVVSKGGSARFR